MKLTQEQVMELKGEMVSAKEAQIVRFLYNGQNLNLITGELMSKGVNVMNQVVYWNFNKATIDKILKYLPGVKAVFSE